MRALVFMTCLVLLCQAHAEEVGSERIQAERCVLGEATRLIELRADPPDGLPCSVNYIRVSEGRPAERLWTARNDATFCTGKFAELKRTMERKHGWNCAATDTAAERPAQTDGTDQPGRPADTPPVPIATAPVANTADRLPQPERIAKLTPEPPLARALPEPGDAIAPTPPTQPQADDTGAAGKPLPEAPRINLQASSGPAGSLGEDTAIRQLRRQIPSGFYELLADPVESSAAAQTICPAGGFFVWNTREPDLPVFELGLQFSVPVSLTARVVQENRTDSRGRLCQTTVYQGACRPADGAAVEARTASGEDRRDPVCERQDTITQALRDPTAAYYYYRAEAERPECLAGDTVVTKVLGAGHGVSDDAAASAGSGFQLLLMTAGQQREAGTDGSAPIRCSYRPGAR